ncbi:MAG: hypothetical protein QOE90_2986 [Thermoplasmata archaeon]|jgi:hypothetical protein|nr:hypothetical protein [Thermoplasmata archaeon]
MTLRRAEREAIKAQREAEKRAPPNHAEKHHHNRGGF